MSTTSRNTTGANQPASEWQSELEGYVRSCHLPARGDQLLAALIRQRCPSRLLWHLSSLPQSRRYMSVDDVIAAADGVPELPRGWD